MLDNVSLKKLVPTLHTTPRRKTQRTQNNQKKKKNYKNNSPLSITVLKTKLPNQAKKESALNIHLNNYSPEKINKTEDSIKNSVVEKIILLK